MIQEKIPHYPVLESELAKRGITKKEIAKDIGISPRAFSIKLSGKNDFWYSEILTIRKYFPDLSIEELFTCSV